MTDYRFNTHIHGCVTDGHLVLLDLKRDEYILLNCDEWQAISQSVDAALDFPRKPPMPNEKQDLSNILKNLKDRGIIIRSTQGGKILSAQSYAIPNSPFEHITIDYNPPVRFHHIISIFLSGLTVLILLKLFSFNFIIDFFLRTKVSNSIIDNASKVKTLAQIFDYLRPILPKNRICLYDSLTISLFMRLYRVPSDIVFGVTGDPFSAHCWVQQDGIVLNDFPQNIGHYSPIMVV